MHAISFKLRLPVRGAYYIVLLSFVISLAAPFASPVFPIFIRSLVTTDSSVGYVASITAVFVLISTFIVSLLLKKFSRVSILKISALGYGICFLILSFVKNLPQFIFLEMFRAFFSCGVFICLGLLLRDLSSVKNIGKIEGWNFTISNIAWFIGPLLGGLIAATYSYSTVFIISAVFPLLLFLVANLDPVPIKEQKFVSANHSVLGIRSYFSNRTLCLLYVSSMGIIFWWVLFYVFLPLFMFKNGLSTSSIGIVLALATLPLIALEIPAGKLADRFGYKRFLFLGFLLLGIASLFASFSSVYVALVFILLGSIGAAFIEPLREAFFFKTVHHGDENSLYPVYKTALEVGRLSALFLFSTLLLYIGYNSLFLVVSIVLFILSLLMLLLREK